MPERRTRTLLPWTLAFAAFVASPAPAADGIPAGEDGPTLLLVDRDGGQLVVVDPVGKAVLGRVPTGEAPHEVAASADGKLAFVANYGTQQTPGRSISIIDIAARKELRRLDLGALRRPHGLAVVEGKVYFTAEANRVLGRLDPMAGPADVVDRIIGLGQDLSHMVVASPDGSALYTANMGSNSITGVDRRTGRLNTVAVAKQPEGIGISPDGKEVWAGSRAAGEITVVDAGSLEVKATIEIACPAYRLLFTPDGRHVLIPDMGSGSLVVVDPASRKVAKVIDVGGAAGGVVTDRAGRIAYVALPGGGKVAIVDLGTLSVSGTIPVGSISDGMAWAESAAND
ncbi:MAG: YncE family protein [Isosphaeraceae bacterium]